MLKQGGVKREKTVSIEDVLNQLKKLDLRDIISEINSDKYHWQGYNNGARADDYQGLKCIQRALVLIVAGRVLPMKKDIELILSGDIDPGITRREAIDFFFDHLRHIDDPFTGYHATSYMNPTSVKGFYRTTTDLFLDK